MANKAFPYTPELKAFQAADDVWGEELRRIFGKNSGDARYSEKGKGQPGSKLWELHQERERCRAMWYQSAYS
jgi:hypothetical protein